MVNFMQFSHSYDKTIAGYVQKARREPAITPLLNETRETDALITLKRLGYDIDRWAPNPLVGKQQLADLLKGQGLPEKQLPALTMSQCQQLDTLLTDISELQRLVVWKKHPDQPGYKLPPVFNIQRAGEPTLTHGERAAARYAAALEYRASQIATMLDLPHKNPHLQSHRLNEACKELEVQTLGPIERL